MLEMLRTFGLFLVFAVTFSANGQGYNSRSCSSSRMRDCRDTITKSIQKRINDMNTQEKVQHCRVVREDFNCLMRETRCLTSKSEIDNNGDILLKGLAYIRDSCESRGGGYRDSTCYQGDDMKHCENPSGSQYSSRGIESCEDFNRFESCVMTVLKNRCRMEDDLFIGQHLVVKGQEKSWSCQDSDSDRSQERDYRGGRYGGSSTYDRDRYGSDRSRDRDRDRDNWRQSDYGSDRYSDRYDSGRYDRNNNDSRISGVTCCRNEMCDSSRQRLCSSSLSRAVEDRSGGYHDEKKCRQVRDDFNCLLWQTTCLPREERDRAGDLFRKALKFISDYCDTYSRWTENSCFKSSDMQRCETSLSTTRGGANYESCRAYTSFRSCMEEQLQRRCTREDDLLQGAYLVEKAQEMAWLCGNDNVRTGTRGYNDRYNDRNNDRNNDRYNDRNSDRYNDRYNDRNSDRYNDRYDDRYDRRNPYDSSSYEDNQHLDADDEMCMSRLRSPADDCRDKAEEKKRQLITENDYDRKRKGECCASYEYRRCLKDASRKICGQQRNRVVDQLLGMHKHKINSENCRDVYDGECSDGVTVQASSALLVFALISLLLQRW